jgi:hypothetical protein
MWVKFKQPNWAKRMERMMARVEDKLAELEAAKAAKSAAISASLDGIQGDIAAQSTEIAALKQAVIDAGSTPGELPQELVDRFDALKASLDTVIQRLRLTSTQRFRLR